MNRGGFSWRRLLGISAFKSRISRTIGIPLTASGRRRKLGASIFNAVGPVAGTLAVAAASGANRLSDSNRPAIASEHPPPNGVHFCQVKGITHPNDDGTSREESITLCSIGETVKLVADPKNEHDKNAIRVLVASGQQIGYISARQAARFAGKVQLLTATIHSRVRDEWGNDTIELRVVNSEEQKRYSEYSSPTNAELQPPTDIRAIETEARETESKEGWQRTLVYFESADGRLYQVVPRENEEQIRQTLGEGMNRIGFIGLKDAPSGIQFGFALADGISMDGLMSKRFVANAHDWAVTNSKDLCTKRGLAAPVVHDFQPSSQFRSALAARAAKSSGPAKSRVGSFALIMFGIVGLLLVYRAWWAAGIIAVLALLLRPKS